MNNTRHNSIKKNMLMNVMLTSANFIFPLISFSYVSRALLPEGTGKVAFVTSIISYFSYIAVLGIPSYGVREAAKIRDDRSALSNLVQELLIINLLSTLLAYIMLAIAVVLVPRFYSERLLFAVMSISIILQTLGMEWVYQALEEYSYITIRSLIFKTISVILIFRYVHSKEDYVIYGLLSIFTTSASYLLNFVHIRKYVSLRKRQKYQLEKHLKPILTLFASSIIITIYANFDVAMIGFIIGDDEVGLYNAALKIKAIILSLSTSVTAVIVPRMAYYLKENKKENAIDLIIKSFRVSMILAIPISVYIFIFADRCIEFFCGGEFLGAVPTLRVLIACVFPLVLTNLFGNQILVPSGNEKRYSQSVFIGLWINLLLNLTMIPTMGAFGAAIGTFVTECWNVYWMSGGYAKEYRHILVRNIRIFQYIVPILLASFFSVLISKLVFLTVFWELAVTGVTFFGVYYSLLLLCKEPMVYQQMLKVVSKVKGY